MKALALTLLLLTAPVGAQSPHSPSNLHVTQPLGLLLPSDLIYQGAFRVPQGGLSELQSFKYGGGPMAYRAATDSLFIVGNLNPFVGGQLVAEISIPVARTGVIAGLNVATLRQPFTDVTEGGRLTIDANVNDGVRTGGLLVWDGTLYSTAWSYYDAMCHQTLTHFSSNPDLAVLGDVRGPLRLFGRCAELTHRDNPLAGMTSGYFAVVPASWRAALGGPVLNGHCCTPIVSRTSVGPSLFAIDPVTIGSVAPVPLVYYPMTHPLADWWGVSAVYNGSTEVNGAVFPEGTQAILFFGAHGLAFCYGTGTTNPALAGTFMESGEPYCFDPPGAGTHGTHAFPMTTQVWAVDAADLAEVHAKVRQPWDVRPYATWPLPLPYDRLHLGGVAYDPATGRIFLSQLNGDGDRPIIHVLSLKGATP